MQPLPSSNVHPSAVITNKASTKLINAQAVTQSPLELILSLAPYLQALCASNLQQRSLKELIPSIALERALLYIQDALIEAENLHSSSIRLLPYLNSPTKRLLYETLIVSKHFPHQYAASILSISSYKIIEELLTYWLDNLPVSSEVDAIILLLR